MAERANRIAMPSSALYIRMPGLLGPVPADAVDLVQAGGSLDAFAALLSRGRFRRSGEAITLKPPGFDIGETVDDLPVGALSLLGDGGDPGDAYWLRADPVQYVADRDRLRLLGPDSLGVTDDEAAALVRDFNGFYRGDGIELVAPRPDRWYLRCALPPALYTVPLPRVIGGSLDTALPTGADAAVWHARLNEIQMFFHGHAVNEARSARGEPLINGLWPWGGGRLPAVTSRWSRVFSEDPLVTGLGRQAGVATGPWPESPADVLDGSPGETLLAASLPAVSDGESFQHWESALQRVAEGWVPVLTQGLSDGALEEVRVDSGAAGLWTLRPRDRWAFWRRPRPLSRLLLSE